MLIGDDLVQSQRVDRRLISAGSVYIRDSHVTPRMVAARRHCMWRTPMEAQLLLDFHLRHSLDMMQVYLILSIRGFSGYPLLNTLTGDTKGVLRRALLILSLQTSLPP